MNDEEWLMAVIEAQKGELEGLDEENRRLRQELTDARRLLSRAVEDRIDDDWLKQARAILKESVDG